MHVSPVNKTKSTTLVPNMKTSEMGWSYKDPRSKLEWATGKIKIFCFISLLTVENQ